MPSHPSQEVAEYEQNRGVCEGYKRKSDMGIFSKIHAYVLIKTRREFIHLRAKTPAFDDTRNQVFYDNEFLFLLAHFLFIPKFAYPAIGTK